MVQHKKGGRQRIGARQIYDSLRDQISDGVYEADGLLPSSRALASELGVSRTTVTVAYEQLAAEGFIDIRQGVRPRVVLTTASPKPSVASPGWTSPIRLSAYGERLRKLPVPAVASPRNLIADFQYGDLAASDFPTLHWKRAIVAALAQRPARLMYDDPRGTYALRAALQRYLWRARMLRCDLEQIVVVNGSQQALDLCARLLLDRGDRFVIEDPCYAIARHTFSATGARAVPVAVDQDGLDPALLGKTKARLAYVTPSHQFPLGRVMSVGRRYQLLEWARKSNAYVVEDDYDSEYRYDIKPVPPLYALGDGGNVIYVGTVSKTLSPTLRIGYLVVPHALEAVFATGKHVVDRHTPLLEQAALTTMLERGTYDAHVRKIRRRNGERRATLLNALRHTFGDKISIEGADAGLHIVAWLRDVPLSMESKLTKRALDRGVRIHSVAPLYDAAAAIKNKPDHVGLVMGYASLDTRRIERGVHLLAEAVNGLRG
ncbi:MocR-like pyridoxine biosynthesis transcription factor PdxR [Hyphomicrobium sp.]|uniref:MocR-like pyridoxine biosynthesis transcription factor PdxR n=1 Tax=Hyphomicrobium sp. TaxID=82 RepID=UPI002FE350D4